MPQAFVCWSKNFDEGYQERRCILDLRSSLTKCWTTSTWDSFPYQKFKCRNPSFGLATKARACKGVGQKGSPEVTSHAPKSVGKCEGMNLHTPKWAPTLGVGVSMDFQTFKKRLQGTKPIGLKNSLYHWKTLGMKMSKMGLIHLDTSNTGYGKKKSQDSNWQFDSRPLKVENRPDFLACRWHATYYWKVINEGYNFF